MPLKLTCPHCGHPAKLVEPFPLPGAQVQCEGCGAGLAVSYPDGVVDRLKTRGRIFQSEESAAQETEQRAKGTRTPKAKRPPARSKAPLSHRAASKSAPKAPKRPVVDPPSPTEVPTAADPTMVQQADPDSEFDRTIPSARNPYGNLPGGAREPEADRVGNGLEDDPTDHFGVI